MKYYILEKLQNKLYGPVDTKKKAVDSLHLQIETLQKMLADEVILEEVLDEYTLSVNGKTLATYEIIDETQLDGTVD